MREILSLFCRTSNQKKTRIKSETKNGHMCVCVWGGGGYWSRKTCPFGNTLEKVSTNEIGNQFLDVIMAPLSLHQRNQLPFKAGQTKREFTVKPG